MARKFGKVALGTVAILIVGLTSLSAQQGQLSPGPQPGAPMAPPAPPPSPASALPDGYKLNMMIRTAVIALNQANQTGNYTVLRDLGATSFRASNDASRLAEIFAALRKRQLDLSPVLFFLPKLVQPPQVNERGILRLVGYFETAPERINFDIYYVLEAGQWRMFGIGVLMSPAVDATAALPEQSAPAPASNAATPGKNAAAQPAAPAAPRAAVAEKPTPPSASRIAPKPAAAAGTPAQAAPAKAGVENKATNNPARIQLGGAGSAATEAPATGASIAPQSEAEAPASTEKPGQGFLPFW